MRMPHRLLAFFLAVGAISATGAGAASELSAASSSRLPTSAIDKALQIKGTMIDGVLTEAFDRTDISNVKIHGVPIKPAFMINGDFDFQSIGHGRVFMNGDLPVKPSEINRVIDAIISNGLVFQAEHQHMYDFNPQVYFIHVRGTGNPVKLAQGLHAVLKVTGTPLPQTPPSKPKTPLDVARLKSIMHGYDAEVGDDGVVTVYVARRKAVHIGRIKVNPATNIATNISFEPLNPAGTEVAAIPDFAMVAGEINRVMRTMRSQGWDIGCLYNQETAEAPQLFFSHQFKTGNPYELASEVEKGLRATNSK